MVVVTINIMFIISFILHIFMIVVTIYNHNHINDITMVTIYSSSYIVTMVKNQPWL